jgi:hypothetical protein
MAMRDELIAAAAGTLNRGAEPHIRPAVAVTINCGGGGGWASQNSRAQSNSVHGAPKDREIALALAIPQKGLDGYCQTQLGLSLKVYLLSWGFRGGGK